MNRIREIVDKNSTGKKVLILFIIANLFYAVMLLITIPKTMSFSNGMKLLDMMPAGYDSAYINSLFETLGNEGRESYLYYQIPIDMIYPFFFGIGYCFLFAYFLKKLNKFRSSLFYLCLLPIIAGIADYLENFGIIILLKNYPDISQGLMSVTNIFSVTKSSTTSIYFLALIVILITLGYKTISKRKTSANGS